MHKLQGILLRLRLHKITFTADIKKAFLKIELNKKDRDATRFLWFKDMLAFLSGEFTNSAKYFSYLADVSNANGKSLNGTFVREEKLSLET